MIHGRLPFETAASTLQAAYRGGQMASGATRGRNGPGGQRFAEVVASRSNIQEGALHKAVESEHRAKWTCCWRMEPLFRNSDPGTTTAPT